MERTTISLPEDIIRRLRMLAAERRVSMAALIREAIDEKLQARHPLPRSLGIAASGLRGTAKKTADHRSEPRSWR